MLLKDVSVTKTAILCFISDLSFSNHLYVFSCSNHLNSSSVNHATKFLWKHFLLRSQNSIYINQETHENHVQNADTLPTTTYQSNM